MKQSNPLSLASKLTVVALLIAALGFATQIAFGLEVPTIPPGLIILLVAAALVTFVRQPWVPGVGVAVGAFLLVGFFASGALANLLNTAQPGIFAGAWVQFIAVIATILTGIVAVVQNYRSRPLV
jgi:hypothetical protein